MRDFDLVVELFIKGELDIRDFNFCTHNAGNGNFSAYIMGEGAEQCLAYKDGFSSEQEVIDFFKSLGVTRILRGVG